jgi:hypothetical protein
MRVQSLDPTLLAFGDRAGKANVIAQQYPYQYYHQRSTGERLYKPEPCPYCDVVNSEYRITCGQCGAPL